MRLINCQIQNVRIHADLLVEFSPQVTLIGGPNETGKSTLIEALHRTLFLKASATGSPIEALRSKIHLGHPTICLTFEAKGEIYTLRKCFSGSSGHITLSSKNSSNQLSGPRAEEHLASLVGVKETLGSRQANKTLATRWAHLWVMQGSAGTDLLKTNKANYDFDSLLTQLEKGGGAAIQQSEHDQQVGQRIDRAINENLTSRGIKKNSELWHLEVKLNEAKTNLKFAQSKQLEYEQASEYLVETTELLNQLQNIKLPKLRGKRLLISEQIESGNKLKANLNIAKKELEPIHFQHKVLKKVLLNISQLRKEISLREKKQLNLKTLQNEKKVSELILEKDLKSKKETLSNLKAKRFKIEQKYQFIQLLVEKSRLLDSSLSLKSDIKRIQEVVGKKKALNKKVNALAKIERSELQHLRDLSQVKRDANTRQRAMGVTINVLRAKQNILINGEELKAGEQIKLSQVFELKIGEDVNLEIIPGEGEVLNKLRNQYLTAEQEMSEILTRYNLESIQIAEKHFEYRLGLKQQLAALEASSPRNMETIEEELKIYNQKINELESQLLSFEEFHREFINNQSLPNSTIQLFAIQKQIQQTYHNITSACDQAEDERESTQKKLQSLNSKKNNDNSELLVIENAISDRQEGLRSLQNEHGDHESLVNQLSSLNDQLEAGESHLIELQNQLSKLAQTDRENELINIQHEIKSLEQNTERVISQKGAAKASCESISSTDPYATVEHAEVELEIIKAEHQTITRVIDAHKLLQQLFLNAQADLSSRYTQPLALAINSYLQPLASERGAVQINFNQASGFSGLLFRRGTDFFEFEQLSGGMKEQLSAALRLSMADVLKEEHNGCLPLVFDDAFTNSDPQRISLVKQMISKAVNSGLQVILLTCDPEAYWEFANQKVRLG